MNLFSPIFRFTKQKSAECNADFLPCYTYVSDEKKMCRPPRDNYVITETVATIPLQPLAIHTADRILEIPYLKEVVLEMKEEAENGVELELEGKIGSDT